MRPGFVLWVGRLALVIGSPLLLFGLLELAGWGLGVTPIAHNETFEGREFIRGCRWNPAHLAEKCDPERYPSRGKTLVLALGGSSMFGHPFGERRKITRFLQARLDRLRPNRYTVYNLGRTCKDSIFVRRCVERTLAADPDVLVIYSGHNDFSGFMARYPEILMLIEKHGWWIVRAQGWLAHTRAFSMFMQRAASPITHGNDPRAGLSPDEVTRASRVILEAYTENLRAIIELAGRHGIAVILVTLVSNLHEFPIPRQRWNRFMRRVRRGTADTGPWARFYSRGIEGHRGGRFQEALESFKQARDEDPRSRAPSILNRRIRELSAAYPHVHLVDFERQLDRLGLEEGIGCNFFGTDEYCDGVHPNPRTNRLIGEAVADRVIGLRRARPGASTSDASAGGSPVRGEDPPASRGAPSPGSSAPFLTRRRRGS